MVDFKDLKQFAARIPVSWGYGPAWLDERGVPCSRCDRWFGQQLIDRPWLQSMNEHRPLLLKSLLKTCEVEVVDGIRKVYFPARCGTCDRALLAPTTAPVFQGASR